MTSPHNKWVKNSLVAFCVEFYILFKLFYSFSTQPSRLCLYLYYTFPNSISHHFQLLSPAFYVLSSLFIITHSFPNKFASTHYPLTFLYQSLCSLSITPTTYCSNTFLSSSRLSSKISLSSTLSLRESLVILQAEWYWRSSKAKARWNCQCLFCDYITLLLPWRLLFILTPCLESSVYFFFFGAVNIIKTTC